MAADLAELLELIARALHSRGYAEDLYPAQWMALRYFAKAPTERRTASELARFQGLANGPVSRTVRTLVSKGMLQRATSQPRGRAEIMEVTALGLGKLKSDPTLKLQAAVGMLSGADQEAVERALRAILRQLLEGD